MEKTLIQEIEMLALFMGYEGQHEEWCGNNIEVEDQFSESGKSMMPYNPNENYNQLFEIVEAIEAHGYFHAVSSNSADKGRVYSDFHDRDCKFSMDTLTADGSRISAIYKSVVKAVEYLNSKKTISEK